MTRRVFILLLSSLVITTTFASGGRIKKLTEPEKINMLIDYIGNLQDAVFIRNGIEHTAKEAAEHLKMKYHKAGSKIKTAVEFIVHIGSKSSISGKSYMIKFSDGKTVASAQILAEELKRIEKANQ